DRPVDHIRSSLTILRDGKLIERLQPRLESAPTVLFARAPTLPEGSYQLHWTVHTMAGADVTEGDIPFSVQDWSTRHCRNSAAPPFKRPTRRSANSRFA